MQRGKLYNLHTTGFFCSCTICFQNGQQFEGSNFNRAKTILFLVQDKFFFSYFILLQLFCVNCRAFHAASFDTFYFSDKEKWVMKIWDTKRGRSIWRTRYDSNEQLNSKCVNRILLRLTNVRSSTKCKSRIGQFKFPIHLSIVLATSSIWLRLIGTDTWNQK